jgi:Flp pilus assembly protein TadD/Fe-S cluster assembly iron-binding protein IscA
VLALVVATLAEAQNQQPPEPPQGRIIPTDAERHFHQAVQNERNGDMKAAISEYKDAIKQYPDYSAAHYNLGRVYLERQEYADAIAEFKVALQLKPTNADAHNNLGLALKHNGDLNGALAEYKEAVRLNPKMASAQNNLANVLYAKHDFKGAIEHYRAALELNPNSAQTHMNLGSALDDAGKHNDAIAEYNEALKLDPGNANIHQNLAIVYQKKKDMPAVNAELKEATKLSLSPTTTSVGRDWAVFNQKRDAVWDALVDTMTSYNWRPQTLDATSGVVFFQSDGRWGDYWGANNALVGRFTTKHVGGMATWVSVALQTNARVKAVDEFHTEVRFTVKYTGCNGAQAMFDQYSKCHWEPLESNGMLESEMLTRIASHLTQLSDSELNPPSKPESNVVAAAHEQVMAFQKLSTTFELNAPPDRILSALVDTKASLETFRETPESRTLPKFTAALDQAIHNYVAAANAAGEQRTSLLGAAEGGVKNAKKCLQNYQEYVQEITPKSAGTLEPRVQESTPRYMQQTPPSSTRQAVVHQQEPRPTAVPPQEVIVDFRSTPTGADIRVDQSYVGSTPASISMSPGQHIITISKQGCKNYEQTITVTAGYREVAAYLEQQKVTIQFDHHQ